MAETHSGPVTNRIGPLVVAVLVTAWVGCLVTAALMLLVAP